ncbi:MAG: hypothetical protein K2I36_01300, partial [Ureaplasma sp.]|nr:hypothetical protein [Ureaplasma sp.]
MYIGFTKKNSVIHNLNPSLKFIAFVVMIVMIFLPLGFFSQSIILVFILVCLLYPSDAADDLTRVDNGGRLIIKKKKGVGGG